MTAKRYSQFIQFPTYVKVEKEGVTILVALPMTITGFVGYGENPRGLKALTCVWAGHLSKECRLEILQQLAHVETQGFHEVSRGLDRSKQRRL